MANGGVWRLPSWTGICQIERPHPRPMTSRRPPDISSSEITPEAAYLDRRDFIRSAGLGAAALAVGASSLLAACSRDREETASGEVALQQPDKVNSYEEATSYNN